MSGDGAGSGPATETQRCFVVEAALVDDAARRRAPHRTEHLTRISKLEVEGVVVVAGAFDDLSASLLVLRLDSPDAAAAVIETDVYWRNGVWTGYEVRALNRVMFAR